MIAFAILAACLMDFVYHAQVKTTVCRVLLMNILWTLTQIIVKSAGWQLKAAELVIVQ